MMARTVTAVLNLNVLSEEKSYQTNHSHLEFFSKPIIVIKSNITIPKAKALWQP